MNILSHCVLSVALAAGSVGIANADVAVTNENNGDGGTILFVTGTDVNRATSFTTGPAGATISSVDLRLANRAGVGSTEQYFADIHLDAGGIPGALVGSFNSINFTQTVFNQFQPATFTTGGIAVNASTTYWLVLRAPTSTSGGDWLGTQLSDDTSSIGWSIGNHAMVFAGGGGPGWIQVGSPGRFTINLLPTPAAAGALGLGGLFASRRRR